MKRSRIGIEGGWFVFWFLAAIGFLIPSAAIAQEPNPHPLHVVVSFLPLYAHTKAIAGDLATVEELAGNGIDPHEFQPRPSDMKKIASADLLIVNGVGLESWLDATVQAVGSSHLEVIVTGQGIPPLTTPHRMDAPVSETKTNATGTEEEGINPHVWLDPVLAKRQAMVILAALQKADPAHAAAYEANAKPYFAQLDQLDSDFRALFARLHGEKNLVTFHDAFPYFAARYGLHYLGYLEEFPEKSPSPRQLGKLTTLIQSHHVQVLFAEEGYEPKLLRTIAQQTGATVAELDTIELGAPTPTAYLDRMRSNLAALEKAWQ